MMQAMPVTASVTRRFADDQLVTLAKLVIESALQPIVEVSSGYVFGYESLMRGQQKLGFATPVELLDQASAVDLLLPMEQMLLGRAIAKFSAVPESPSKLLFVNFDARLMGEHAAVIDRMLQVLLRAPHLADERLHRTLRALRQFKASRLFGPSPSGWQRAASRSQ